MSTAQTTPAPKTRKPRAAAAPKAGKAPRKVKARASDTGAPARKPRAPKVADGAAIHARSTDALREAAKRYVHDKENKTSGGHVSVNNGDKVANMLLGKSLEEVYKIASEHLGDAQKDLKEKYGHLNVGMIRMNLGNRLRAVLMPKK